MKLSKVDKKFIGFGLLNYAPAIIYVSCIVVPSIYHAVIALLSGNIRGFLILSVVSSLLLCFLIVVSFYGYDLCLRVTSWVKRGFIIYASWWILLICTYVTMVIFGISTQQSHFAETCKWVDWATILFLDPLRFSLSSQYVVLPWFIVAFFVMRKFQTRFFNAT